MKSKNECKHGRRKFTSISRGENAVLDMTLIFTVLSIFTVVCIFAIFYYVEVWGVKGKIFHG